MSKQFHNFDAGDLSLDYANTLDWHASENPIEQLNSYDDFVAWGVQAQLISEQSGRHLRQKALKQPEKYAAFLKQAITVRESIYSIFSRRYSGKPLPENDLQVLNSVVQQAMSHLQLVPIDGKIKLDWMPDVNASVRILWSVARAAAELLTSDKAKRVRECEDDRGCGYLFIDQTKNHSRRWCSMDSCGNRAKAHRHYTRVKKPQASSSFPPLEYPETPQPTV